jgi:hypothetical protein
MRKSLSFNTILWFGMQKVCKNELLRSQHTRFHKKKNFVILRTLPLKHDIHTYHKRNMHLISIHLNNHNIQYVNYNIINGTKLIDIEILQETQFHQLRITVYLCRLLPNYDSESKKLTRITLQHTRYHNNKNYVFLRTLPFIRDTCTWIGFIWKSTTFTTSNVIL